MKSTKDFRGQDSANDYIRKAAKLEPIKKSGKEKHQLYKVDDDVDEDDEFLSKPKRESVFDYIDDEEEDL